MKRAKIFVNGKGFRIKIGRFFLPSDHDRFAWEDREIGYSVIRGFYARQGKPKTGTLLVGHLDTLYKTFQRKKEAKVRNKVFKHGVCPTGDDL